MTNLNLKPRAAPGSGLPVPDVLQKEMPPRATVSTRTGFALILVALVVTIAVKEWISVRRQNRAMQAAQAHLEVIRPQWDEFKRRNPNASDVTLRSHTGPLGSIAAEGFVPDEATTAALRNFLEESNPPNGVRMMTVVDPVRFAEETR